MISENYQYDGNREVWGLSLTEEVQMSTSVVMEKWWDVKVYYCPSVTDNSQCINIPAASPPRLINREVCSIEPNSNLLSKSTH